MQGKEIKTTRLELKHNASHTFCEISINKIQMSTNYDLFEKRNVRQTSNQHPLYVRFIPKGTAGRRYFQTGFANLRTSTVGCLKMPCPPLKKMGICQNRHIPISLLFSSRIDITFFPEPQFLITPYSSAQPSRQNQKE